MKIPGIRIVLIFILLLVGLSYLLGQYNVYNRFLGDNFPKDFSFDLGRYVLSYTDNNKVGNLTDPKELDKLRNWLKNNYNFSPEESKLLESGFVIKYLPESNLYIFCLFGPDENLSIKNVSEIKNLELKENLLTDKPTFVTYLLGKRDFDLALFAIDDNFGTSNIK